MRLGSVWIVLGILASGGLPAVSSAADEGGIVFEQSCDASAVVFTLGGALLVADDMSDVLNSFKVSGGVPIGSTDLYELTGTPRNSRRNFSAFEGAARLDDKIYFITSHSRERMGKNRPNRRRLLALQSTKIGDGEKIEPIGKAYTALASDLASSPELKYLSLNGAILQLHREIKYLAPDKNGLNIEGLAAGKEGGLLIGLRNPRPAKRAIVIPLENPDRVVLGFGEPRFRAPIRLDLGGLGISSMALSRGEGAYYIVAAPHDRSGGTKLYRWSGDASDAPTWMQDIMPADFSAQALAVSPDGRRLILLSDDGDRPVRVDSQKQCRKKLTDEGMCACSFLVDRGQKSFRGQWIDLPPASVTARP